MLLEAKVDGVVVRLRQLCSVNNLYLSFMSGVENSADDQDETHKAMYDLLELRRRNNARGLTDTV
jgi:hypothetical protein